MYSLFCPYLLPNLIRVHLLVRRSDRTLMEPMKDSNEEVAKDYSMIWICYFKTIMY